MASYTVHNRLAGTQQALASTFKTQTSLHAVTANLRRAAVSEIMVGADAAPNATDCPITWDVSRTTAAGTATAATPTPADPADAASDMVGNVCHTVEPTVTAASSVWSIALNQRASQRWVAKDGSELIIPATNLAGLAGRALSPTYVGVALFTMIFSDR
jgi:hypothetical protein